MKNSQKLISSWMFLSAGSLSFPAVGFSVGSVLFQPMDLLALVGWAIVLSYVQELPRFDGLVPGFYVLFAIFSWIAVGGEFLIFAWQLGFAVSAVVSWGVLFRFVVFRRAFVLGLMSGALVSVVFFWMQMYYGADQLDYRNNVQFRLPPHFGRGFSFFPEVSTLAVYLVLLISVLLTLVFHDLSSVTLVRICKVLALGCFISLFFTASTSVLVLLPFAIVVVYCLSFRLTWNALIGLFLTAILLYFILELFFDLVYADRFQNNSAIRSASMRLASVVGSLYPIFNGEFFGVGVGNNHEVGYYTYDASRWLDLRFSKTPTGVNSHIFSRIFEEGFLGVLHIVFSIVCLYRGRRTIGEDPWAKAIFALGILSLASATLVVGYRGIYTNWIWLSVAMAFYPRSALNGGSKNLT